MYISAQSIAAEPIKCFLARGGITSGTSGGLRGASLVHVHLEGNLGIQNSTVAEISWVGDFILAFILGGQKQTIVFAGLIGFLF